MWWSSRTCACTAPSAPKVARVQGRSRRRPGPCRTRSWPPMATGRVRPLTTRCLGPGPVSLVRVRLLTLPYTRVKTACSRSSGKLASAHMRCYRQGLSAVPQARWRACSCGSHARGALGSRRGAGGGALVTAHMQHRKRRPRAAAGRNNQERLSEQAGCSRTVLGGARCSSSVCRAGPPAAYVSGLWGPPAPTADHAACQTCMGESRTGSGV